MRLIDFVMSRPVVYEAGVPAVELCSSVKAVTSANELIAAL